MAAYDIVIKGGMLFDGTRNPRVRADVGVVDGHVAEIGRIRASDGRRVLDAAGLHVAPGFVDLHTHYDAQVFWDPYCTLSGWHGVTSVAIGNCGFGFAPVAPAERESAMRSMTRVEAVPYNAMREGMPWDWESFPEFLDALEATELALDVGAQVPHGAVRAYVMGERGARNEPATPEDIEAMARIVAEADSQRRELERDLHDGAQQRLVAVALAIRVARRRIADDDAVLEAQLARAEAGVRAAVVALRDVAHGLFPAVLAEEGLAAALEELSEQDPRLVPRALPTGRFPSGVESAAYFAALESLRLTEHDVTVEAVAERGSLLLVIGVGNQTDSTMLQIQDRVGAVGGTAAVCDGRLRVEMPCAS